MTSTDAKIESLTPQEWRRKLAGLVDRERDLPENADDDFRQRSAALVCLLAELFGEELDRLTLWSRIDSAIKTSCTKVRDGNMELFVNYCLEHVKADPARSTSNQRLALTLSELVSKPREWRLAFVRYLQTRLYAVLVHGRLQWEQRKLELKTKTIVQEEA